MSGSIMFLGKLYLKSYIEVSIEIIFYQNFPIQITLFSKIDLMFYKINGSIEEINEDYLIINNNGISYKTLIANNSMFYKITPGDNIDVYTYFSINDNEIKIYGFYSNVELELFTQLIQVSGVGPKSALSILSLGNTDELIKNIINSSFEFVKRAGGIGEKTAKKICIDLKDKVSNLLSGEKLEEFKDSKESDNTYFLALDALKSLGYKEYEIKKILGTIEKDLSLEDTIKIALSKL